MSCGWLSVVFSGGIGDPGVCANNAQKTRTNQAATVCESSGDAGEVVPSGICARNEQCAGTEPSGAEVPSDGGPPLVMSTHLLSFAFLALGAGCELSYLTVISAVDFFKSNYQIVMPNIAYVLAVMFDPFALLTNVLLLLAPASVLPRVHFRVLLTYFAEGLLLVILGLLPNIGASTSVAATLSLVCVAFLGVATGILYDSVFSIAGQISPSCVGAATAGTTVSGLLVAILRIVTKVYPLPGHWNSYSYFGLGCAWCILCCLLQMLVVGPQSMAAQANQSESSADHLSMWAVALRIRWHLALMLATLSTSFSAIPGLASAVQSYYPALRNEDWDATWFICEFNLFNVIGSFLPAIAHSAQGIRRYFYLTFPLRVALVVAFCFYARAHSPLPTDLVPHVVLVVLGLTNGYLVVRASDAAVEEVQEQDQETAAQWVSLCVNLGIFPGSLLAFFLQMTGVFPVKQ